MRILHSSDWHFGKSLEQFSRIEEQRDFVDCLCKIVEEQSIDLVLVAGDIYDTYTPSAAAEELFFEAVDRLNGKGKRAVVVIAGNHDSPERLCAASPLAYENGIILIGYPASDAANYKISCKNIQILNSGPGWFELYVSGCEHNAIIITIPYPSEARLNELLSSQPDEGMLQKAYSEKIGSILSALSDKFREDTINLVVGHLFLRGGKESDSERTLQVGGALTVDPEVLPANAHYAALGHLHRPQQTSNSPCPAFYSGSPLAYSFSEAEHSKAVYIVDAVPGKKAIVNCKYLDCGKPLRRWIAKEGIGQAIAWCEQGRDKDAWVDLEIITDKVLTFEQQKMLRTLHPGIINIRPVLQGSDKVMATAQSRENMKIDELFKDYYKFKTGTEISEDLMRAFIEILNEKDESTDSETDGGVFDETEAS